MITRFICTSNGDKHSEYPVNPVATDGREHKIVMLHRLSTFGLELGLIYLYQTAHHGPVTQIRISGQPTITKQSMDLYHPINFTEAFRLIHIVKGRLNWNIKKHNSVHHRIESNKRLLSVHPESTQSLWFYPDPMDSVMQWSPVYHRPHNTVNILQGW